MLPQRLFALLLCASLVSGVCACAGSMQSSTVGAVSAVGKRPVRASKGSVEKSARK
ncbi:MAG: hypothetical protein ABI175_19950 [Polyangiales bacterium]